MPKETIMSKISDEEFEKIVNSSNSYREIADKCGYCKLQWCEFSNCKTKN